MGFMKDQDAHTRGVGAIAAVDRSAKKRAQGQRKAMATRRHDRAMAAMTGTGGATLPGVIPGTMQRAPRKGPSRLRAMDGFGLNLFGARNPNGGIPLPTPTGLKTYQAINNTIGPGTIIIDPGPAPNPGNPSQVANSSSSPDGTVPTINIQPSSPPNPAPVAVTAAPDDNTNTYLLLGAAAVATYLLFFRKKA